jgi:ABC-2 type transport system ATP-binding protein
MSERSGGPGPAVEVRGLCKAYGDRPVLRGVDFEVRRGEVFCLLGPNGAGKTTTVEILEGFRARTGGSATVLGLDPAAQPARLRERIGIVLQECGFPRQARVGELIALWRDYYPHPRPLGDLLEVTGLADDRNTPVRKLSGPGVPGRADHRLRPRGPAEGVGRGGEPARSR